MALLHCFLVLYILTVLQTISMKITLLHFFLHIDNFARKPLSIKFFHPIKVVVFQNRAKAFSQAVPFEPVSVAMHPTRPIVAVCGAKVRLIEIFWKFICLCRHTYYSVVIFTPICGHIYTNLWSYLHQSAIVGQLEGTKCHGIFSFLPCKSENCTGYFNLLESKNKTK